jgi:hypothetical protein
LNLIDSWFIREEVPRISKASEEDDLGSLPHLRRRTRDPCPGSPPHQRRRTWDPCPRSATAQWRRREEDPSSIPRISNPQKSVVKKEKCSIERNIYIVKKL